MIKKAVLGTVILIFLTVISFGAVRLFSDHSKVADGKYQIQNNETYPNAYILVEDGQAQFFNIDLNESGKGLYNFGNITEIDYLSYEYDGKKHSITLNREEAGLIEFKR